MDDDDDDFDMVRSTWMLACMEMCDVLIIQQQTLLLLLLCLFDAHSEEDKVVDYAEVP